MNKSRVPLQVAPTFEKMLKGIQKDIMMDLGVKVSLRDLTEDMVKTTDREIVKNKMVERRRNAFNVPIKFHER